MRRSLTLCRTGLAGVAAFALLTACGGGSSNDSSSSASDTTSSSAAESTSGGDASSSEFCQQAQAFLDQVQNADLGSQVNPAQIGGVLTQAAGQMRAIDPPSEIADDWTALADAIEQLGTAYATTDFNDPQQVTAFQQTATELEGQLGTASTNV